MIIEGNDKEKEMSEGLKLLFLFKVNSLLFGGMMDEEEDEGERK